MSTSHTSLPQRVFRTRPFESNGFHQSAAIRGAVSRIHIYMLTPQTFRTMVCVAIPFNDRMTMLTSKIFDILLETHRRSIYLYRGPAQEGSASSWSSDTYRAATPNAA